MKKEKQLSRIIAVAGFLVVSSLIISACHKTPIEFWVYGVASSLFILLNILILAAWIGFGEWGLWIFVFLSSMLMLLVSVSTNANIAAAAKAGIIMVRRADIINIKNQISIFFALGLFATMFKNSMVLYMQYLDRQIENLDEERNAIELKYSSMKGSNDALKEKVIRYSTLKDVTSKLSSTLVLDSVVDIAIGKVIELVEKFDVSMLFLVEENTQELALKVARSKEGPVSIKSKKGDIFDIWVLKQRQPLLVPNIEKDFRFNLDLIPHEFRRDFKSLIAAPLISQKKILGVLRVESRQADAYVSDDLRLLTAISDLSATSLENTKLYHRIEELAISDGLTGLYCNRYFKEKLDEALAKAIRIKQPLSLLMLDVDKFKVYNDKYGHIAGDIVLKAVGGLIKKSLDPRDLAARYGGEEFSVILLDKDKADAQRLADVIRKKIEAEKFILRQVETRVTISIGCATLPGHSVSRDEFIKAADTALYEAKKSGGNRICLA